MDIIKIKPFSPYENSIKEWLWMEWGKENNRFTHLEGYYENAIN